MTERDDQVKQYLEAADQELEKIRTSEDFINYLDAQSRFYHYSPRNTLLILLQCPDASRVAGYKTWPTMGRHVLKGEKGIRILAPLKRKVENEETGEPEWRLLGFKTTSVFDVSQTDGDPLPELKVPVLDSEAGGELYDRMEQVMNEEGVKVQRGHQRFASSPHLMGWYDPPAKQIILRDDVSQLQQTKTIVHEAGHHFGHHDHSNADSETEAEITAWVVLRHNGHDTGERSFPYVMSWMGDKNIFRNRLTQIQELSKLIINRLEPTKSNNSLGYIDAVV
jgi:antirestriction protein ArdC